MKKYYSFLLALIVCAGCFIQKVWATPEGTCPEVTGITLSEKTYKSVKVSWTTSGEGTWVLEYGEESYTDVVEGLTETEYTLTGLEAIDHGVDNTYMIKVHPSCSDQGIETTYAPKFTPPTNVQVTNIADVTATASWDPVVDAELGYKYDVVLRGNETWPHSKTTTDVSVNLTGFGLVPNTEYDFKIATRYMVGSQEYLSPGVIIPFKTGAPIAPKDLTVSNLYLDSAIISWENDGGATTYQYAVGDDHTNLEWTNINKKTVTLMNLDRATNYTFYVRSFYSETLKSDSISINFTTKSCVVSELPWNEGFEDCVLYIEGFNRNCWEQLDLNTIDHPRAIVDDDSKYIRTGSKTMRAESSYLNDGYLILPVINAAPLNELQFTYWHKEQDISNSSILTLGYMTNTADASTFVAIKEFERYADWMEEARISLATIPNEVASTARLAFKLGHTASNQYYSGIDDITLSRIPTYEYKYFTFNANGGEGMMDGQEIRDEAKLKPNTFVRNGYTFQGWATDPNGDVVYADEEIVSTPVHTQVTIPLYAKWQQLYTTRPTAKPHLLYKEGEQQALITAGVPEQGITIEYMLKGGEWSTAIPQEEAVGSYYVYYRAKNEPNTKTDTLIASIYASDGTVIPTHDNYAASNISVLAKQEGESTASTQRAEKLFDGNTSSKWCSLTNGINTYSDRPKDMVVWKTAESVKMVSYTLTTGNDTQTYPNRNWKSWTIYGGTFGSDAEAIAALRTETGWTIIDNQIQDSVLKATNYLPYQFACDHSDSYQYYRLVIHEIVGPYAIQQMSELTMGIEARTPTGIEETNANANAKVVKILREGKLYILRDGKTYNAQGVEMK